MTITKLTSHHVARAGLIALRPLAVRTGNAVGGGHTPAGEERDEGFSNFVGVAHVAQGGVAVDVHLAVGGRGGGVGLDGEASLGDGRLARDVRRERVELLGADAADSHGGRGDGGGGANSEHVVVGCDVRNSE